MPTSEPNPAPAPRLFPKPEKPFTSTTRHWPRPGLRPVLGVVLVAVMIAAGVGAISAAGQQSADPPSTRPTSTPTAVAPSKSVGPTPGSSLTAAPGASVPAQAADVLPVLGSAAAMPAAAALSKVITPLVTRAGLGPNVSAEVVDVSTGTSLFARSADRAAVPASTTKLLTSAAALSVFGPEATLATRVVSGRTPSEIVLVGGGDVLLAGGAGNAHLTVGHAGLGDLAAKVATRLRAQGVTAVTVRLDDYLFSGPAINPGWEKDDVAGGYVAPIMALEVDEGLANQNGTRRQTDPALSAAAAFTADLVRLGITLTGAVTRGSAPAAATTLAEVRSAPLSALVEHALTESDNTVAETLGLLVAQRSGGQGSFAAAGDAVLARVALLDVPVDGAHLVGGSGLGLSNAIPARTLTRLLVTAASPAHPELRSLLSGLPVAGVSGTLADRFSLQSQHDGIGVVRAKTGTLKTVASLAGIVVDAQGRLLAFAVMADQVTSMSQARSALDSVAVALTHCGCP